MTDRSKERSVGGGLAWGQSPAKAALAESWSAFCEGLHKAGIETLEAAGDSLDAADGLEQIGVLLGDSLRWHLRGADPDQPRFIEINDTPEVADNIFAAVRGDAVYRLTGNVSSLFDINLSVHSSWAWIKPSRPSGDRGLSDLSVGADGSLEIILGGEARPGNWLALPPDAAFIQLREYHADYASHTPGQWNITRIDCSSVAPARQTPEQVMASFDSALEWTVCYGKFHRAALAVIFPEQPNTLRPPAAHAGGNSHIWYGFGRFALNDDQALILEFDRPAARLWGVQWLLDPWYENPDLLNRLTGITGAEAFINCDGRVRIVFAARDPGIPNWLDVNSYPHGLFVTRWIWCEQGVPTNLSVVPISELSSHLPSDTPHITKEQRAAQLARRRTHYVHRRR